MPQVENLLASKYFCWSRDGVSSTVNMLQSSDFQLVGPQGGGGRYFLVIG